MLILSMPRARKAATARLRRLEGLLAVDRGLHLGIEILHADRDAVDAGLGERRDACVIEPARIELDGELGILCDVEMPPRRLGEREDVGGASMLGDPPPQWMCVAVWPHGTSAGDLAISRLSVAR